MKSIAFVCLFSALAGSAMAADTVSDDLLRFTNDDQLHGRFEGIDNGTVLWRRDADSKPMQVKESDVRQIVLRGGRPVKRIGETSVARLVGGDRLPGSVVSFDDKTLVFDTPYAGRLTIPRERVAALLPVPFGGKVRYAGPFNEEGWRIVRQDEEPEKDAEARDAKGKDGDKAQENDTEKQEEGAAEKPEEPPPPAWRYARSAWYSAPLSKNAGARVQFPRGGKSSGASPAQPLVLDDVLGDAAVLRFHLAWRNQLGMYVAFQADFASPPEGEDAEKPKPFSYATRALPFQFGNSYALALSSNYGMLYGCGFDKDGKPFTNRLSAIPSGIRIGSGGDADVELRFDRHAGRILLFLNGEFCMRWDEDPEDWAGKGAGVGFLVTSRDCQVRISDILIADWNGRIDSARSMEADDRDVVLLTNGTDRFSGKVESIKDGAVAIKGSYATMTVPLDQVAEIRFARKSLAESSEPPAGWVSISIPPFGRIFGKLAKSDAQTVSITSPNFGDAEVNLDFASLLDFQSSTNFIDEWDIDF